MLAVVNSSVKMKLVLIFVAFSNLNQILASLSGLYVDNGRDQTVIERTISRREKLRFERDMLDLLGLPRKPRKSLIHNSTLASSAPKFLLGIYKSLEGSKLRNEFNMKSEDFRSVKESDTIMTFLTKSEYMNVQYVPTRYAQFGCIYYFYSCSSYR